MLPLEASFMMHTCTCMYACINPCMYACMHANMHIVVGLFSSIVHWAHRIEDTNTLSWEIYTYLFPPTHRQGDTRRHSLVIDTLTNGRKSCGQRTQWKAVLWRKKRTSTITNYKSKLKNINKT